MHAKEYKEDENFSDTSLGFSINLSAPGKVILFGEHSVVYGKPALAASLGLRTHLNLSENFTESGSKIVLNLEAVKLYHCYEVEDIKQELFSSIESKSVLEKPELIDHEKVLFKVEAFVKKRSGSVPLQKSQHQALVAFFYLFVSMLNNFDIYPFTVVIRSDLDIGAGLGSSASFLVVVSAAFYEYWKHKTERLSVEDINEFSFRNLEFNRKKFSQVDLDLISKWAFNAEKIIHGTPSGLDNTICTYGTMVEYKKMSPIVPLGLKHKLSVILVNSKIPKDTKTLVMKVAALKEKYPKVVSHILNAMEEVTLKASSLLKSLDEIVESRKAVDKCLMEISDVYTRLEDCVDINQNLLRSLGVSHKTLDEICAILLEKNLHGKLTGAGGGGYAFAFIPDNCSQSDLSVILENLMRKGYEARVVELGGSGVMHC